MIRFDHINARGAFVLAKRVSKNGPYIRVSRYRQYLLTDDAKAWLDKNKIDFDVRVEDGQNDCFDVFDDNEAMKVKLRFG